MWEKLKPHPSKPGVYINNPNAKGTKSVVVYVTVPRAQDLTVEEGSEPWAGKYGQLEIPVLSAEQAPTKECPDEARELAERLGLVEPEALIVMKAFLPRELQGQRIGLKMYELALKEASKLGFMLAPNSCWYRGMTTKPAQRVWNALRKKYAHVGDVFYYAPKSEVAAAALGPVAVRAATTPLPQSFEASEPGLMTRDEYLKFKNPKEKFHPSDAYNYTVAHLNETLVAVAHVEIRGDRFTLYRPRGSGGADGQAITKNGRLIAVVHRGTLYTDERYPDAIPRDYWTAGERVVLDTVKQVKKVKYPTEYLAKISDIAAKNLARFDHLLQNITIKGEKFQVRSEGRPVKNKQQTIAVFNQKGEEVAFIADEWGATLLTVTQEYQRLGFGEVLLRLWNEYNPNWQSGGTTPAGARMNERFWEGRVRDFLDRGWYSELVRQGKMTKERVKDILSQLDPSFRRRVRLPEPQPEPPKPDVLLYLDDLTSPVVFVLYDSRFLNDPEAEDREKYILGYGFFRDSTHAPAPFLYRIDYERPYAELATKVAMQMARDNKEAVWVGEGYGDLLELEGLAHIEVKDGLARLTRDVLPLRRLAQKERQVRKPRDPYQELAGHLLEAAESKWS